MKNPQKTEFPGFGSPSNPHRVQGNKPSLKNSQVCRLEVHHLTVFHILVVGESWWILDKTSLTSGELCRNASASPPLEHRGKPSLGPWAHCKNHPGKLTAFQESKIAGLGETSFEGCLFQAISKIHPTKPKTTTSSNPQLSTKPWIFISLSPWRSRHETPQTVGSC